MKAYFTAALRGKKELGENYSKIVELLKLKGFTVVADHIMEEGIEQKISQQTPEEKHKVYKHLLDKIKSADLLVAEISTPSISVGHEISYALEMSKPVVVLHTKGLTSSLLEGLDDDKLQLVEYDFGNIKQVLTKAIEEAKKNMDVRFNFFVSPRILAYLDWVAKNRMIPRAVFLRDLIEKEMKKDREYNVKS